MLKTKQNTGKKVTCGNNGSVSLKIQDTNIMNKCFKKLSESVYQRISQCNLPDESRDDIAFSVNAENVFDIIHYPEIIEESFFHIHHYGILQQRAYAIQTF